MSKHRHEPDLARRRFLIGSTAATLGLLDLGRHAWAAPPPTKIRRLRPLGQTGLEISDISFGSSRTTDPDLVRYALERGVNYFDTAERYQDGRCEEAIGEALQGKRDQVVLASKVKAGPDTPRAEIMKSLEGSLRRLRTDRIDVYFNHAVNDVARLQNGEWFEFADRARAQGKIRFTGISGHGGRLVECLDYALDNDLVDVILCGYNFGQDPSFHQRFTSRLDWVAVQPDLPRVLEKAHAKGVGVVAMKTLRGARLNDMRPYEGGGATFAQAAFRWVLSNPNVDALVISMTSREKIDEFIGASGRPEPAGAELDLLERYLSSSGDGYCNHGCDTCEASCPYGVPVSEVLRTRMYATDYGDRDYASREYAHLAVDAASCASCALRPCLGKCPQGLEIPRLTRSAHRLLGASSRRDPARDVG
jgi:predicted aldo/keto reductase-like oxidoreductase